MIKTTDFSKIRRFLIEMYVARLSGGVNKNAAAFWKALIMYLPLVHPNIAECEHYWGTPDGSRFRSRAGGWTPA